MTHDFAIQNKTGKQNKTKIIPMPPWLFLTAGIAIGLFANLLFKLNDMGSIKDPKELILAAEKFKKSASLEAEKFQSSRDSKNKNNTKEPNEFTHKPKFDFYTILPEQEAFVPSINDDNSNKAEKFTARTKKTETQSKASTNLPKSTYYLQTGSFREYSEAHKLKGKLVLAGLNVKIQTVTMSNSETWHRVQVGPFQSKRALSKAQNSLAKINIDSMVLKQKT